jgi:hypothetical protein
MLYYNWRQSQTVDIDLLSCLIVVHQEPLSEYVSYWPKENSDCWH